MSDHDQIDTPDTCRKSCMDALDSCFSVTDYMTSIVCGQNYSACAGSCEQEDGVVRA
jgi:hypothetical protein